MIISGIVSGTYTPRIHEFVRVDAQDPVTINLPPSEPGEPIEFRVVNSEEAITFVPVAGETVDGHTSLRHGGPGMWLRLMGVEGGWLCAGYSTEVANFV